MVIAGVIDPLTNFVEHPEVVADRIERVAQVVGDASRVQAGTDCGFDTSAGRGRVAEDVVWAKLKAMSPDEVNALSGKDVVFQMRDFKVPFTAENFILSFSLPNFHFHATTTYDILRTKGVPLGKRDYMGALRMKT